jgi:DNA-binding NarL/FixJ family response regulator
MSLRVLLCHHYPLALESLKSVLEAHGFTTAGDASGQESVRLAREMQPDVAILDLELASAQGQNAIGEVLRASPRTKAIVLSQRANEDSVQQALEAGAKGYVLKNKKPEELIRAISEVCRDRTYFSAEVSEVALHPSACDRESRDCLTRREWQVIKLIAEGNSTKEVAVRLGISVKTADCHRTRLMGKLNFHETATLVRYAVRQGLVQP